MKKMEWKKITQPHNSHQKTSPWNCWFFLFQKLSRPLNDRWWQDFFCLKFFEIFFNICVVRYRTAQFFQNENVNLKKCFVDQIKFKPFEKLTRRTFCDSWTLKYHGLIYLSPVFSSSVRSLWLSSKISRWCRLVQRQATTYVVRLREMLTIIVFDLRLCCFCLDQIFWYSLLYQRL